MQSTIEQILRKELKKLDAVDELARRALYDRVRQALRGKALRPDGAIDQDKARRLSEAMDNAERAIEAEYSDIDLSPLDQAEAVKIGVTGLLGLASAAAALAAGMDFFSLVLNDVLGLSTMAVYMLAGLAGLVLTAGLARVPAFAEYRKRLTDGFRAAAAVALVGASAFGATMLSPEARERGLIAAFIPGAAQTQDDLLGRLELSAQETADGVRRIEEKVSVLKKETSDDPCKELANLRSACDLESIHTAVIEGNARVVSLYLQAGLPVPAETIGWFLTKPFDLPESAATDVAERLLAAARQIDRKVCGKEALNLGLRVWQRDNFLLDSSVPPNLRAFYVDLCGRESLRATYEAQRAALDAAGEGYDARVAATMEALEDCATQVFDKHAAAMEGAGSEAEKILEQAWNDGFDNAWNSGGRGEMTAAMVDDLIDERLKVNASIRHLVFESADLRRHLADFALGGCDYGMAKPVKPQVEDYARIERILAALGDQ